MSFETKEETEYRPNIQPMPWLFRKSTASASKKPAQQSEIKEEKETEYRPNIQPMPWLFNNSGNKKLAKNAPQQTKESGEKNSRPKFLFEMGRLPELSERIKNTNNDRKMKITPTLTVTTPTPERLGPSRAKKTRMDPHVKKELFKRPNQNKNSNDRKKTMEKDLKRTRSSVPKQQKPATFSSPLIDIEEVEEQLINNEISTFASPNIEKLSKSVAKSGSISDATDSSEKEFLLLEQKCLDSPVSSVCNLLKATNIQSAKKLPKQIPDITSALSELETAIQEEIADHERRLARLNNQKEFLKSLIETDKENTPNRRSLRLALRNSPLANSNCVSPVFTKKLDLRKSTLTKNLTTNMSPKSADALKHFNQIKESYSYLETPKTDKVKKSGLSNILHEQIYSLGVTPARK